MIRSMGKSKPELRMAARIRSRLSRTVESGSPTVEKLGRPLVTSTSTQTLRAWMPWIPAERMRASMASSVGGGQLAVNVPKPIQRAGPGGG